MEKRLFLLDVDDTLFDTVRYKQAISAKLDEFLPNTEASTKFWSTAQRFRGGTYYWHEVIKAFCTENNCVERQDEVFNSVLSHEFVNLIFPEVKEALGQLKQFGTLAVFSTGDSLLQQVKVQQSGLAQLVSHIFIFDDKIKHIQEVVQQFPDYEIWFIDNHLEFLEQAKQQVPNLHTAVMIRKEAEEIKTFIPEFSLHNLNEFIEYFNKLNNTK